jgi:hypothetical protein
MSSDERHRRMDATRVRAELTVQELWLRYIALGGTGDAFDVDGYLQGLTPLDTFQQDVLAQALNERLDDLYRAHRIPLSIPAPGLADDAPLEAVVECLLREHPAEPPADAEAPRDGAG